MRLSVKPYINNYPELVNQYTKQEQIKLIASNIVLLREKKGMSQLELSNEIGMSAGTVGNIEAERSGISIETLLKILNVLEVKPSKFFKIFD
ncbi:MAG: helix-turn-helix domain-containing protein [Bacteriovoracaceae bacterium]